MTFPYTLFGWAREEGRRRAAWLDPQPARRHGDGPGAAEGAALLAHWEEKHAPPKLARARAWRVPGLEAYQERWEKGL